AVLDFHFKNYQTLPSHFKYTKCKTTDSQAYFTQVNRLFSNVYSKMNYFDSICRPDGIRTS
ncbi:TPA: hypothetical protein ACRVL0_001680, partial [Staphylococcus aureus]